MTIITPPDIERFRSALLLRLGWQFDDSKLGQLGEVLNRRLIKRQAQGGEYLASLERSPPPGECDALAEELTVTETYFFRNHEQFDALTAVVLPDRLRRQTGLRRISLLSAACASGEEAYSLAIAATQSLPDAGWRADIRAADLNPAALAKARHGRYSAWALRETPAEAKQRWFTPEGSLMAVDPSIRRAVRFESANLVDPQAPLWQSGGYDVIFCRNVLMYFSVPQRRAVIERLTNLLLPGGYLFLGHAETMTGLSDAFHLHHTHDSFYYQRKEGAEAPIPRPIAMAPPDASHASALYQSAWADAIRATSERVTALLPETAAEAPKKNRFTADLTPALDLLRREQFADALAYIGGQPQAEDDPDAMLLRAVLLQQSGKGEEAEQACARLLVLDELSAGAHYVLALCRENAGDPAAAAEHDRVAAYLDPSFAMPRLHLGLLARRAGERDTARRELAQALLLLESEGAARLLMYGGGFNREALTALCRASLQEIGGRP
jgi:chemotaxis protein methyltransferase CheR